MEGLLSTGPTPSSLYRTVLVIAFRITLTPLFYRVYISNGSGSGSRTDSSFLAVPVPVLRRTRDHLTGPGPVPESTQVFWLLWVLF